MIAHWIAESRIAIEEIRLLTLKTARSIDTLGSAAAKKEVRTFGQPVIGKKQVIKQSMGMRSGRSEFI